MRIMYIMLNNKGAIQNPDHEVQYSLDLYPALWLIDVLKTSQWSIKQNSKLKSPHKKRPAHGQAFCRYVAVLESDYLLRLARYMPRKPMPMSKYVPGSGTVHPYQHPLPVPPPLPE